MDYENCYGYSYSYQYGEVEDYVVDIKGCNLQPEDITVFPSPMK